jgi:hypothetical protein
MAESRQALVTVHTSAGPPSLEAAARELGVDVEDLDASFGVVPLDVHGGLYAVQVKADRLPAGFEDQEPYRGPFSDPKIDTFGPPRTKK